MATIYKIHKINVDYSSIFIYREYQTRTEMLEENSTKKGKKGKKANVKTIPYLQPVSKSQHIFMKLPKKGEFDLNSVLDSIYFFS